MTPLQELQSAIAGLTQTDVNNAANFHLWMKNWGIYVEGDGKTSDRPPVKPPQ